MNRLLAQHLRDTNPHPAGDEPGDIVGEILFGFVVVVAFVALLLAPALVS